METKETRACAHCGRLFVPHSVLQKYCRNADCPAGYMAAKKCEWNKNSKAKAHNSKRMLDGKFVQHCIVCGKQFLVENFKTKICSEECRRIRGRYIQQRNYAKQHNLPLPAEPAKFREATQSCAETNNTERRKEMFEQHNQAPANPIRGFGRKRYTPEELNEKLDAKTKRIIETIHALEAAGIDESVVFEAVKSINRMPLNNF